MNSAHLRELIGQQLRIFRINVIHVFQFRLRALMWFFVGSTNVVILLLYWWAVLRANPSGHAILTIPFITTYYIIMAVLSDFTVCHEEEDISRNDIYKGDFYRYLLRPYPYLLAKFQEEIVWRLMGGFWGVVTVVFVMVVGLQLTLDLNLVNLILVMISLFLGLMVSFFLKAILGLLSIWFTNIHGIMSIEEIISIVLAGFVLPLHLLPHPLQTIAMFSPWAAPTYYPVAILTQSPTADRLLQLFLVQIIWIIVLGVGAQYTLRRGVKAYKGVSQ
jgi:ABC-2 type transport system permease protein